MRLRSAPVSTPLRERLGPLSERPFRLLFSATTISTFGDAVEHIPLAFVVLALPGASAGDLGFVLATRTVLKTVVVSPAASSPIVCCGTSSSWGRRSGRAAHRPSPSV
jgi:hypothetical protein